MKYCGIGSRKAPRSAIENAKNYARRLALIGVKGLSGGALGMDDAFERGAEQVESAQFRTFIPKVGFREQSTHSGVEHIYVPDLPNFKDAMELASSIHEAWNILTYGERCFHARNCYEVLDLDLKSPVDFTILWAPLSKDGRGVTGGTNSAYQLSKRLGIPCFNMVRYLDQLYLESFIVELEKRAI